MWCMIFVILLGLTGRVMAQESRAGSEQLEAEEAAQASNRTIVRFNTDIRNFDTAEAFQKAVLSRVPSGAMGTCYASSGGMTQATREPLPWEDKEAAWKKTVGKGWEQFRKDRIEIEYRFNEKANVLLWIENVKPRFFFAYTRKMCELRF